MGFLQRLLGLDRRQKARFDPRRIARLLGPWRPYGGADALPRTRIPCTLTLPRGVARLGDTPGPTPISQALIKYWLRLDPQRCSYARRLIREGSLYTRIEIPRPNKEPRRIAAPAPYLRFVQRRILQRVLEPMEVHPAAHGFVKGRSIFTNAAAHVNRDVVVRLDLRDFFPSIGFHRVVGVFRSHGLELPVARTLADLCCLEGRLPQGAPTSPTLSNLVCRRLDARLAGLARRIDARYTRYADDITFSGSEAVVRSLPLVRRIIADEGFALAPEKTAIMRRGARQRVTGLNVNTKVSVPRTVRRVLRAVIHNRSRAEPDPAMVRFLGGYIAFMKPAHPEEAARLARELLEC